MHNSLPYDSAGYALRTLYEAKAYQAQGYQVLIVTRLGYPWDLAKHRTLPKKSTQWIEGIEIIAITGTRQYKVDSDLKYALQYAQKIADIVRYRNVDIIQASSNYINGLAGYLAGGKCKIPFIYEARGMWHVTGGSKSLEFRNSEQFNYEDRMEQFVLDHASANIFITDIMRSKYHHNKSIPTLILNNGIDIHSVMATKTLRSYRKGQEFKLLYAGSLVFYEGVEILIRAVSELTHYKISLDIYGDGPYLETVKQVLSKLASNNINYHGKIPQNAMMSLYPQYHSVVIPRINCEVTRMVPPLKPMEALWHGLPIIVSHLPALTELLEGIKSVLFTEPENINSLKKNILLLMHNYPEIMSTISKDIEFIKNNKTWDIEITKMTNLLSAS
ncbi:glycosyltransferase [Shewanella surugensis]|uniref:Glycosyltransferase n=1 Tax=Shewanella surugensis TaxID=212020 RepID=A0ABT0LHK6_9GAMM|nr:glycosyltransferase [Shewanella surugensis]MCL1126835.1 glycosyltransferase [Shewanella surugensis]